MATFRSNTHQKHRLRVVFWLKAAFVCVPLVAALSVGAENGVVRFYWQQAADVFRLNQDVLASKKFIARVQFARWEVGHDGTSRKVDSLLADISFVGKNVDSIRRREGNAKLADGFELVTYPVFEQDYDIWTFANDTGGADYFMGFDTKSSTDDAPSGMVVLGRNTYVLHWLYLSYPEWPGHRRYSRTVRYRSYDGMVVMDSLCEVGSRPGFVRNIHYRNEIGLSDFRTVTQ